MCAGVDMRSYRVIYDIVDDIRALMEGKLASVEERTPIGEGEVRAIFGSGSRIVAGCMINEGLVRKGCHCVVSPMIPPAQALLLCNAFSS